MKKLLITAVLAAAAAAPSAVLAFGLPPIPGLSSGASSGAAQADLSGQQDSLTRNFNAANQQVLTAQGKLLSALGLKDKAEIAERTAASLGEGATSGSVSDINKVVLDTSGAIAEALAKKPELDAASRAVFTEGLAHLVSGTVKYVGLGKDVKNMGASMKSASPLALAKLSSAAYVVTKFPTSASNLYDTLKHAVEFGKSQGLQAPGGDDALKALAGGLI